MTTGRRKGALSWFVEPYLQIKLGLMFLIVNFVFAAVIGGVFWFYLWDIYNAVALYFQLSGGQGQEILNKLMTPLVVGAALLGLFILTTILVSVRYTHHIYGPLVSIHRFLDDILNRRPARPLQLRESDQLKDLAAKLNSLAELHVVDERTGVLSKIYHFLDEAVAGNNPAPIVLRDGDPFQDLAKKVNTLAAKLHEDKLKKAN